MTGIYRALPVKVFGDTFAIPWPNDWPDPAPPPVNVLAFSLSYLDGSTFTLHRGNKAAPRGRAIADEVTLSVPWNDENGSGQLGRAGWDRLQLPREHVLQGQVAWHVFKLLRAYQTGAAGGDVDQWLTALAAGSVHWRALELLRPDLVSVPALQEWRAGQEASGAALNPRGRPKGSGSATGQFRLDLVAVGIREVELSHGREMTWRAAAERAVERFPSALVGTLDEMVHRLEKRQKPQAKWRALRRQGGGPPDEK
jgi:hypothetical protein